jgi:uncharacterized protein (DUF302 family)
MTNSTGVVTTVSPRSVSSTVDRLVTLIANRGLTLFAIIDHSGGARDVGLEMPDTKLLIFGSPEGGTRVMLAAPMAALDLPLKVLVSEADERCLVTYVPSRVLAERYDLPPELLAPLDGVRALVEAATAGGPP